MHSFVTYQVFAERREALVKYCEERGIECKVHYPIPLYCQEGLKGLGNVPRLANVHPIYLVRQLYNFQTGANSSTDAALMKRIVAKLTDEDIVNLTAYAASLPR